MHPCIESAGDNGRADKLGPIFARVDPARMKQVFNNLLANAIKFTPTGGRVSVRCRADESLVTIEVADTGRGMNPAMLNVIFNPFEQGNEAITKRFGGMGLGLSISRALVDLHGGALTAQSEGEGKGAVFAVRLPRVLEAASAAARPERPATPVSTDPNVKPPRQSRSILLVEDHLDSAEATAKLLTSFGHRVKTVATFAQAVEALHAGGFDVLLTDIGLTDGSGWDLLSHARAACPGIQGIALSGYGADEDVARSRRAGFIQHLIKPVSVQALDAAIQRLDRA
jgi:two-component system CheB/CheR fusion protein